MFKKLDGSLGPIDIEKLNHVSLRNFGNNSGFHDFDVDYQYLHDIIDKKIKFKIEPDNIMLSYASVGLRPHKDLCDVTLNYYLETNNEVTAFYRTLDKKPNNSTTKGWFLIRKADSLGRDDELEEIASFVAKNNELWLLDTSVIHIVKMKEGTPERSMIRCVWYNRSFEEILNSIVLL
jgi:hypothetical protein